MRLPWLLLSITLTGIATAQTTSGKAVSPIQDLLCNKTFNAANASGIFTFDPGVTQFDNQSGIAPNASYAVTVAETWSGSSNATTKLEIWYDSGGANYSDDLALGYDVCSIILPDITNNTLLRGQSDNGTCLSTFDASCVQALQAITEQLANTLVQNPTPLPHSNLTAASLPNVCDDITTSLMAGFPRECSPFFGNSTKSPAIALTGYNSTYAFPTGQCTLNGTFQQLLTEVESTYDDYSNAYYDLFVYTPWPILTVFLPVANAERRGWIQDAKTSVSCVRVDHFNPGARVSPALPSPTPDVLEDGGNGLSKGAIAGIIVAAVVSVVLMAGTAVWCVVLCRRRRRKSLDMASSPVNGGITDAYNLDTPHEMPTALYVDQWQKQELPVGQSHERFELEEKAKNIEADSKVLVELDDHDVKALELDSNLVPAELEAEEFKP